MDSKDILVDILGRGDDDSHAIADDFRTTISIIKNSTNESVIARLGCQALEKCCNSNHELVTEAVTTLTDLLKLSEDRSVKISLAQTTSRLCRLASSDPTVLSMLQELLNNRVSENGDMLVCRPLQEALDHVKQKLNPTVITPIIETKPSKIPLPATNEPDPPIQTSFPEEYVPSNGGAFNPDYVIDSEESRKQTLEVLAGVPIDKWGDVMRRWPTFYKQELTTPSAFEKYLYFSKEEISAWMRIAQFHCRPGHPITMKNASKMQEWIYHFVDKSFWDKEGITPIILQTKTGSEKEKFLKGSGANRFRASVPIGSTNEIVHTSFYSTSRDVDGHGPPQTQLQPQPQPDHYVSSSHRNMMNNNDGGYAPAFTTSRNVTTTSARNWDNHGTGDAGTGISYVDSTTTTDVHNMYDDERAVERSSKMPRRALEATDNYNNNNMDYDDRYTVQDRYVAPREHASEQRGFRGGERHPEVLPARRYEDDRDRDRYGGYETAPHSSRIQSYSRSPPPRRRRSRSRSPLPRRSLSPHPPHSYSQFYSSSSLPPPSSSLPLHDGATAFLLIRNLPPDTRHADIIDLTHRSGCQSIETRDVIIPSARKPDASGNMPPAHAFINFSTVTECRRVRNALYGINYRGHNIDVNFSYGRPNLCVYLGDIGMLSQGQIRRHMSTYGAIDNVEILRQTNTNDPYAKVHFTILPNAVTAVKDLAKGGVIDNTPVRIGYSLAAITEGVPRATTGSGGNVPSQDNYSSYSDRPVRSEYRENRGRSRERETATTGRYRGYGGGGGGMSYNRERPSRGPSNWDSKGTVIGGGGGGGGYNNNYSNNISSVSRSSYHGTETEAETDKKRKRFNETDNDNDRDQSVSVSVHSDQHQHQHQSYSTNEYVTQDNSNIYTEDTQQQQQQPQYQTVEDYTEGEGGYDPFASSEVQEAVYQYDNQIQHYEQHQEGGGVEVEVDDTYIEGQDQDMRDVITSTTIDISNDNSSGHDHGGHGGGIITSQEYIDYEPETEDGYAMSAANSNSNVNVISGTAQWTEGHNDGNTTHETYMIQQQQQQQYGDDDTQQYDITENDITVSVSVPPGDSDWHGGGGGDSGGGDGGGQTPIIPDVSVSESYGDSRFPPDTEGYSESRTTHKGSHSTRGRGGGRGGGVVNSINNININNSQDMIRDKVEDKVKVVRDIGNRTSTTVQTTDLVHVEDGVEEVETMPIPLPKETMPRPRGTPRDPVQVVGRDQLPPSIHLAGRLDDIDIDIDMDTC
eukprot:gene9764-20304_t